MSTPWDRRAEAEQVKFRDAALQRQLTDAVGPFSPFWRERFASLGIRPADIRREADLARVPAVGERDICPGGDPAGAAALVLRIDESGFARRAAPVEFRTALLRRAGGRTRYRRHVEAAVRPVSYHLGGLGLSFPVASTRGDLDIVARAGARAWRVAGLGAQDVLVSALPPTCDLASVALPYAALGAGAPAFHVGTAARQVLGYVAATVVAVPDAAALAALGPLPASVRTVLVTGSPQGVPAIAGTARVLRLWGPGEGRVLYAECRPGSGLHTYPDLEVFSLVDPATGEECDGSGELVVTQLELRGSALLRWRTGAVLTSPLLTGPCPDCGRTVPRLPAALRTGALVPLLAAAGTTAGAFDLRSAAGVLTGRADLAGWRLRVRPPRSGSGTQVLLQVTPTDPGATPDLLAEITREVEAACGRPPSEVLLGEGLVGPGLVLPAEAAAPETG